MEVLMRAAVWSDGREEVMTLNGHQKPSGDLTPVMDIFAAG